MSNERLVPATDSETFEEVEGRRRLITFMAKVAVGVSALYGGVYALVGYDKLIIYSCVFGFIYLFIASQRSPLNERQRGVILMGTGLLHLLGLSVLFAAPAAGNHYFLMGIPILAFFVVSRQDALWWWFYSLVSCASLTWLEFVRDSYVPIYFLDTAGQDYSAWRAGAALMTLALIVLILRKFSQVLGQAHAELRASVVQVESLLSEVEAANSAKSAFLAQMSHDLRTPLNGILGTCEALREDVYGTLSSAQAKALSTIEASGQHQLALVNDLLDLAKIEEGALQPIVEPMSLIQTCRDIVRMLRERAKQAELKLILTMDMEVDHIQSDRRRLQQILLNLVGNAIKFTPAGGEVRLTLESDEERVSLSVSDTGIGIAEDNLPDLFKAFTQVDSPQQRKHVGSGLGLHITATLVELLGGRIEVTSEQGVGSTFAVHLPYVAAEPSELPEHEAIPSRARDKAAVEAPHLPAPKVEVPLMASKLASHEERGLHVLLVDDTEANIGHLRDFLSAKGHRVSTASNGLEAIELAQALPDIIFMDVQMPEMDGIEAIKHLRANPKTKDLHVVALTSFAAGEDEARCLAAGADGYEAKPVSIRKVLALVEARRP